MKTKFQKKNQRNHDKVNYQFHKREKNLPNPLLSEKLMIGYFFREDIWLK